MIENAPAADAPKKRPSIQEVFAEYGTIALVIHWMIFFSSMGTFYLLMKLGLLDSVVNYFGWSLEAESGGGFFSRFFAYFGLPYLATQVIKPLRFGLMLALLPLVGRWWKARKPKD